MKFAIRDDDLNYFYTPKFIEDNIKDIWDICPFSMSAVPYIKGNWLENTKMLEELGPKNVLDNVIRKIQLDNKIYDIANNVELINYIKQKIDEKKIYLTIHGIHHRNEDDKLPELKNNYSIGAEFYTNRDLTKELKNAVEHLENIFDQKITIFTPPQNIYNLKGLEAIINNKLSMCAYLPSIKVLINTVNLRGPINYLKYFKFKIVNRGTRTPYPYVINSTRLKIIDHRSLQPRTNIEELYSDFESVYKQGGNFVLSTHSYGFNHKMKDIDKTMGIIIKEFLQHVQKKDNVNFVTLDNIINGGQE